MSGGHWDYRDGTLASEMFGWDRHVDYGEEGFSQARLAAKDNPLHDKEMSELLWDMFCVIHSCDWWLSGDTGEERYRKDVKYFKDKWLKSTDEERVQHQIDNALEDIREELEITFGLKKEESCEC